VATAQVSLLWFLAATVIGPARVLAGRSVPIHIDLRRDAGIWAGLLAIVHVAFGIQVHVGGDMVGYFLLRASPGAPLLPRHDLFGVLSYLGVLATLVIVMLLAISNDAALARLGAARWKQLQRLSYIALGATVLHGVPLQVVEKRHVGIIAATAVAVSATLAVQFLARRRRRFEIASESRRES
jgi:sulfoxide reductase heme-binding subunit YedZ